MLSRLVLPSQELHSSARDPAGHMTTMASSAASSCSGNARTPSPAFAHINGTSAGHSGSAAASASSSSAAASHVPLHAPRPRHHVRSFSTEKRFGPWEDNKAHGLHTPPSQSGSSSVSIPQASMFSPPPTRAKRSPSIDGLAAQSAASAASATPSPPATNYGEASSSTRSQAVAPNESIRRTADPDSDGSRSAKSSASPATVGSGSTSADEREQVAKLRQAQANRRPRVQRLTPAFSSLPYRMPKRSDGSREHAGEGHEASGQGNDGMSVEFPTSHDGKTEAEPGAGLQIDLACIPSPSLSDLHGPISTSHVETMVRDKHGNPVKPSLKNARSGGTVSQMLPGRTTRSDSTPSLPLHFSKSVPTTPTVPKNVKFDTHLEHVKLFKNRQRPTAVSRDGSPEQTETETEEEKEMYPYIWGKGSPSGPGSAAAHAPARTKSPTPGEEQLVLRLPNFPSSTRLSTSRPVFLERIFLADDLRSVKGTVQIRNLAFEKWVAIRYTLDHWATIGEVSADYTESVKGGQADRFSFSIKLNELLNWPRGSPLHETKSMSLCVRCNMNKQEYWDNNENLNYQLDFRRRPLPTTPASTPMAGDKAPKSAVTAPNAARKGSEVAMARVFEMARQGGVGGKGVFAMDELRRELEKLRSDEEDDDSRSRLGLLASDARARHRALAAVSGTDSATASPPKSPDARASSPSMWSARYDFGRSLRDSGKGGKSSAEARTGAFDYFSSRPAPRTASTSQPHEQSKSSASQTTLPQNGSPALSQSATESPSLPVAPTMSRSSESTSSNGTPALSVSAASPPMGGREMTDMPSYHGYRASAFNARFGMFSPGIDETVHHMPTNAESRTPSACNSPSPGMTPTAGLPMSSANSSTAPSPEQYYLYSLDRQGQRLSAPASGDLLHQRVSSVSSSAASSPLSPHREAPSMFESGRSDSRDLSPTSPLRKITTLATNTEDTSPPSEEGSPNPFSPSVSISSMDSDTTVSNGESKIVTGPKTSGGKASQQGGPRPRHATFAREGDSTLRPASMSDYNEIVSRFCWNADIVPSGGSMLPDMPTNGGYGKSAVVIEGTPTVSPSLAPAIDSLPSYLASSTPVAKKVPVAGLHTGHAAMTSFIKSAAPKRHGSPGGGESSSGSANGSGASTPTLSH